MTQYKAIIVDDEAHARATLRIDLEEHCPDIAVVDQAANIQRANVLVEKWNPDIVFLDILMPGGSGMDFLASLPERNFYPVIVSSHSEFAIDAIKEAAFDFILKPVDPEELKTCMSRFVTLMDKGQSHVDDSKPSGNRLEIREMKETKFLDLDSIHYLKASGSYTEIITSADRFTISKNLKQFEERLPSSHFFRINHNLIVNLREVDRIVHEGNYIFLKSGDELVVSTRRKDQFLQKMRVL